MRKHDKIKNEIINMRINGKSYREIIQKFNVGKSTVSYYCSGIIKPKDKSIPKDVLLKLVSENNNIKQISIKLNRTYFSIRYYLKIYGISRYKPKSVRTNSQRVCDRRRTLKKLAVDYKGGKCIKCDYSKCIAALEFHHRDKSKKDFSISAKGAAFSWEKIKVELDKCDLLCANCHREEHVND